MTEKIGQTTSQNPNVNRNSKPKNGTRNPKLTNPRLRKAQQARNPKWVRLKETQPKLNRSRKPVNGFNQTLGDKTPREVDSCRRFGKPRTDSSPSEQEAKRNNRTKNKNVNPSVSETQRWQTRTTKGEKPRTCQVTRKPYKSTKNQQDQVASRDEPKTD